MSNLHEEAGIGTAAGAPAEATRRRRSGIGWMVAVVAAAVVAVLAALSLFLLSDEDDPFGGEVAADEYQAVVLTNDRVYFGRLQGRRGEFFLLTDVYFLRDAAAEGAGDPVRQVVPLTAELHGPEDRMLIHESQLVLVENLAPGSAVLETIHDLDRP